MSILGDKLRAEADDVDADQGISSEWLREAAKEADDLERMCLLAQEKCIEAQEECIARGNKILELSARPEVERIEHLQMQIGYLAAMVSLHTGREIPALVEEAARKTSPKPQNDERKANG